MKRYQYSLIQRDLSKKMVLLVGPRQAGKTFLAREIGKSYADSLYLNYDDLDNRKIIANKSWLPTVDLLILDELHKMPDWKNYLKGLYDTKPESMHLLVTGSARLNTFSQMGDSLAGRYFVHHLLPISLAELSKIKLKPSLAHLMERGGFPEPYLASDNLDAKRWRMQYINSLLTTDVFEFDNIQNINGIRLIFKLLQKRVGSPVSYQSISEDVGLSPNTVKKYIDILEALFVVFRVSPYSKNIARSIKKEPKIYFFDSTLVEGNEGIIVENLLAVSLLKETYAKRDYLAKEVSLHYLRTKENKEVDFAIANDGALTSLIEVKNQAKDISKTLRYFVDKLNVPGTLVVHHLQSEYQQDNIKVITLENYLNQRYL